MIQFGELFVCASMPKIRLLALSAVCMLGATYNTSALAQAPINSALNPYPDEILSELLESCTANQQRFHLTIPLSLSSTTTIRAVTDQQIADTNKQRKDAEVEISKQALAAEIQVEQQVQQRQAELAELIRNPKNLAAQLRQMQEAIDSKQVSESQLADMKKLLKDLQDIQRDPSLLAVKADESRRSLFNEIKKSADKALNEVSQPATQRLNRLKTCTCKIETLQRRYSAQAFYKRSLDELTTGPAISKDWSEISKTCSQ
jgi:hypothetical protein